MLGEPNLALEKASPPNKQKFMQQTKSHAQELKQEAGIKRIKSNKKENRYSPTAKKEIKQCKYCSRTQMRGVCPAFNQTCNNCHEKGHFANIDVFTNKSFNYVDNQNT